MKQSTFTLILLFLLNNLSMAQHPPLEWVKKIEAVDQNSSFCSISLNAVDEEGAIYTSGYFIDSL